jgi:hypothetical protein
VNGAILAATAQKRVVGRIDDNIDLQLGDITFDNFHCSLHDGPFELEQF